MAPNPINSQGLVDSDADSRYFATFSDSGAVFLRAAREMQIRTEISPPRAFAKPQQWSLTSHRGVSPNQLLGYASQVAVGPDPNVDLVSVLSCSDSVASYIRPKRNPHKDLERPSLLDKS
jgi:hypothetical protein